MSSAVVEEGCSSSRIVFIIVLLVLEVTATSVDRLRLVAIAAGSKVTCVGAVHDQFIGLQQNRQYDVSCREDMERKHSSLNNTSTNRGENAQFCCASEFGKLVAGQGKAAVVFEIVGRRGI